MSCDIKERILVCEMLIERHDIKQEKLLKDIGRRFQNRTFENFNSEGFEKQYKTAFEYCRNFNGKDGLMFIGDVGTGKTHLAAAIAHNLIEQGIEVSIVSENEFFRDMRNFEQESRIIQKYKKVQLLIVDDVGKEKYSDWNHSRFFEIVNSRYEDYKAMKILRSFQIILDMPHYQE